MAKEGSPLPSPAEPDEENSQVSPTAQDLQEKAEKESEVTQNGCFTLFPKAIGS